METDVCKIEWHRYHEGYYARSDRHKGVLWIIIRRTGGIAGNIWEPRLNGYRFVAEKDSKGKVIEYAVCESYADAKEFCSKRDECPDPFISLEIQVHNGKAPIIPSLPPLIREFPHCGITARTSNGAIGEEVSSRIVISDGPDGCFLKIVGYDGGHSESVWQVLRFTDLENLRSFAAEILRETSEQPPIPRISVREVPSGIFAVEVLTSDGPAAESVVSGESGVGKAVRMSRRLFPRLPAVRTGETGNPEDVG